MDEIQRKITDMATLREMLDYLKRTVPVCPSDPVLIIKQLGIYASRILWNEDDPTCVRNQHGLRNRHKRAQNALNLVGARLDFETLGHAHSLPDSLQIDVVLFVQNLHVITDKVEFILHEKQPITSAHSGNIGYILQIIDWEHDKRSIASILDYLVEFETTVLTDSDIANVVAFSAVQEELFSSFDGRLPIEGAMMKLRIADHTARSIAQKHEKTFTRAEASRTLPKHLDSQEIRCNLHFRIERNNIGFIFVKLGEVCKGLSNNLRSHTSVQSILKALGHYRQAVKDNTRILQSHDCRRLLRMTICLFNSLPGLRFLLEMLQGPLTKFEPLSWPDLTKLCSKEEDILKELASSLSMGLEDEEDKLEAKSALLESAYRRWSEASAALTLVLPPLSEIKNMDEISLQEILTLGWKNRSHQEAESSAASSSVGDDPVLLARAKVQNIVSDKNMQNLLVNLNGRRREILEVLSEEERPFLHFVCSLQAEDAAKVATATPQKFILKSFRTMRQRVDKHLGALCDETQTDFSERYNLASGLYSSKICTEAHFLAQIKKTSTNFQATLSNWKKQIPGHSAALQQAVHAYLGKCHPKDDSCFSWPDTNRTTQQDPSDNSERIIERAKRALVSEVDFCWHLYCMYLPKSLQRRTVSSFVNADFRVKNALKMSLAVTGQAIKELKDALLRSFLPLNSLFWYDALNIMQLRHKQLCHNIQNCNDDEIGKALDNILTARIGDFQRLAVLLYPDRALSTEFEDDELEDVDLSSYSPQSLAVYKQYRTIEALARLGLFDSALQTYRCLPSLEGVKLELIIEIHRQMAQCYRGLGSIEESAEFQRKALASTRRMPASLSRSHKELDIILELGFSYFHLGRIRAASEQFQEVHKRAPIALPHHQVEATIRQAQLHRHSADTLALARLELVYVKYGGILQTKPVLNVQVLSELCLLYLKFCDISSFIATATELDRTLRTDWYLCLNLEGPHMVHTMYDPVVSVVFENYLLVASLTPTLSSFSSTELYEKPFSEDHQVFIRKWRILHREQLQSASSPSPSVDFTNALREWLHKVANLACSYGSRDVVLQQWPAHLKTKCDEWRSTLAEEALVLNQLGQLDTAAEVMSLSVLLPYVWSFFVTSSRQKTSAHGDLVGSGVASSNFVRLNSEIRCFVKSNCSSSSLVSRLGDAIANDRTALSLVEELEKRNMIKLYQLDPSLDTDAQQFQDELLHVFVFRQVVPVDRDCLTIREVCLPFSFYLAWTQLHARTKRTSPAADRNAFFDAIHSGNVLQAALQIFLGVPPSAYWHGQTPWHVACAKRHLGVMLLLSLNGGSPIKCRPLRPDYTIFYSYLAPEARPSPLLRVAARRAEERSEDL